MQIVLVLLLLTALILLQLFVYRSFALSNLDAEICFSTSEANCGDDIIISESIMNRKKLPLFMLIIKFEAPRQLQFPDMTNTALSDLYYREDLISLGGWKQHIRHITVRCKKRGYYEFERLSVATSDPLLLSRITATYVCSSSLTVLPRLLNSPDIEALFIQSVGDTVSRFSLVRDPFSFSGIREYQPWDSFNKINWHASARKGDLMVNTSDSTISQEVTILLNVRKYSANGKTELIEKAISLAYSFSLYCIRESLPISLISNGKDILSDCAIDTPHGSSENHGHQIGLDLARIDLKRAPLPFDPLLKNAAIAASSGSIVIISANYDSSMQSAILALIHSGKKAVWVVPRSAGTAPPDIFPELEPFTILWEERYDAV
jgi:uncharacterized protein (DUF58 family)